MGEINMCIKFTISYLEVAERSYKKDFEEFKKEFRYHYLFRNQNHHHHQNRSF